MRSERVERSIKKSCSIVLLCALGDVREIVTFDMSTMSFLKGLVLKCPYFTDVASFPIFEYFS